MSIHDADTMRAFVIPSAENPSVTLTQVPVPSVEQGQLLVRMQATGVGIHD